MNIDFDKWYWSYYYGSKACCIKAIQQSDLTEEEKQIRIKYHLDNMGYAKDKEGNKIKYGNVS